MTASSAESSSLVGQIVDDRYEVLELLGEGGVGLVYRAQRVQLERTVALKVLREALVEDSGFVGRFQREAVAMSRLYHPHCVAVTDFGMYGARPYLVLEYVPGRTVKELLKAGPFKASRAVHIALQLLETLEYFHGHHVVHRDLKSENVMLVESSGTRDFVKVLDFGMAKILMGPGADSQLSVIGFVPGTPSVMAPEQIQQLPPDPRIDIYAMGILMYEMIVGQRPFRGSDMATVVRMQVNDTPTPPRAVAGDAALSPQLEAVILKALEKDRLDRFGTVGEMAEALRDTPEGRAFSNQRTETPVPSARASRATGAGSAGGRPRLLLWMGIAAAALLAVAVGVFASLRGADAPEVTAARPIAPEAAPPPQPSEPPPPPAPVVQPWLAHRDLAATYSARERHDEAFREVQAAIEDDAQAATADDALVDAAARALSPARVAYVVEHFGRRPHLVDALVALVTDADAPERRHAALAALRALGQEQRADLIAVDILELQQATGCGKMRALYNQLRKSDDPRVSALKADLRRRDRKDPHARCLRRQLRH